MGGAIVECIQRGRWQRETEQTWQSEQKDQKDRKCGFTSLKQTVTTHAVINAIKACAKVVTQATKQLVKVHQIQSPFTECVKKL